jgi:alkylation response protein AidB-like acyl-CoA dehydrogenase
VTSTTPCSPSPTRWPNLDHPVKTEVADWARQELATGDRVGADLRSEFAAADWKRCADRGIHGVMVPTELGGAGADLATTLLTLEGLGHGCRDNGLAFAIGSQILSTQETIVRFGSEAQQREWIPP